MVYVNGNIVSKIYFVSFTSVSLDLIVYSNALLQLSILANADAKPYRMSLSFQLNITVRVPPNNSLKVSYFLILRHSLFIGN